MFTLSYEDNMKIGYLTKEQFLRAMDNAGIKMEKINLEELFEYFAESFSSGDVLIFIYFLIINIIFYY